MAAVDFRQGDYRSVAQRLLPAAERLVERCSTASGDLVVDVAAGSGNVARLCAQRGARVVAVDLVPEQLALGRADGVRAEWVAGDMHRLPLRDRLADAVLSAFGVIYAERPDDAVRELGRVCRPGGRIGLTAWAGGGYQADSAALLREAAGGRDDGPDPVTAWGTEQAVRERLEAVADDVEVRVEELVARFRSLDAWWESRSRTAPTIVTARQRLDDDAFAELGQRLRDLAARYGRQDADGFELRDPFLVAAGRAR